MWERVVGHERGVDVLRRAAARPVHAYLLSGPPGSGVEEAARCFAAALLCPAGGCGTCSTCERVLRGRHPDAVEVEPEGTQILVAQAASIVEEAYHTPVEAERKVILVYEAERMNETVQNKLLKTFEEPPARTVFLLLTSAAEELLPTVRSRCQEVAFTALTEAQVRAALVADGVSESEAGRAARLAGGRLDRARALLGEYRELRAAFAAGPSRLDGTGAAVAVLAAELMDAVEAALAAVKERHRGEVEELEEEVERAGYPDRVAARLRRSLVARHQRVEGRARVDAFLEGLTVLEGVYRDTLVAPAPPYHGDEPSLGLSPRACLEAMDACETVRREAQRGTVLNWTLHLQRLLLRLPAAVTPSSPAPPSPAPPSPSPPLTFSTR